MPTAAEKIQASVHDAVFVKKIGTSKHIKPLVKTLVDAPRDSVRARPRWSAQASALQLGAPNDSDPRSHALGVPLQGDGADLAAALVQALTVLALDPYVGEAIAVELTDDAVREVLHDSPAHPRARHNKPGVLFFPMQVARLTKGAKPAFHTAVIGLFATLAMHAGRPEPEEEKKQPVHVVAADGAPAVPRVPLEQRPTMALFARIPQQAMNVFLVRSRPHDASCPPSPPKPSNPLRTRACV